MDLKTKWFTGLLEEVKVDMQTLLTCIKDDNIPYNKEVVEFILLERLIRYPSEKTWSNNFDAGTGLFLQSYFYENKILTITNDQKFTINFQDIELPILNLIDTIENIEKLTNDQDYLTQAKAYVYTYLKKDKDNYFNYPDFLNNTIYKSLIGTSTPLKFIPFDKEIA